jgi:hypothetical protein
MRLRRAHRDRDDGDTLAIVERHDFIERQQHRVHVATEDGVHHPGLEAFALDTGDRAVVFDTEQNHATTQVRHRDDLPAKLFGPDVIALELNA